MNVSGTLLMPVGAFTASELQAILLADISAYLNISREFITVIVLPVGSGADLANSTTPAPRNASNATYSGRRLLDALSVYYDFTALFHIPSEDQVAYAQIQRIVNEAKPITITDSRGYRLVVRRTELLPGYFGADGNALKACPDGQDWIFDMVNETLLCPPSRPVPRPPSEWGGFVGLVAALLVGLLAYAYMRRTRAKPTPARTTTDDAHRPTVSVEYHRVPAHLI
jgi:hypothetical protein